MIVFKRLTFKNFLSVGNQDVTINLNETKTTLIHGTNGSGKSTVLDALTYSLFNKPARNINLPQLLNSQNKKGLLTEIEFSVGRNDFTVLRGMKPKVFKIFKNGEELDSKAADKDNQQHLEQNILKMNLKTFLQVVILGSTNYIPFMAMSAAHRRDCVEDFLDIKVFSTMSVLAKERLRGLKDTLRVLEGDINNADFKIEVQEERVKEIQQKAKESTQEYKNELKQISEGIARTRTLITRVELHQSNVLEHRQRLDENKPAEKVSEVQKVIAKLEQKSERLQKEIDFYADKDDCPTCLQAITLKTKNNNIQRNTGNIKTNSIHILEGQKVIDKMSSTLRLIGYRDKYLSSLHNSLTKYYTELENFESRGKKVVQKIREIEDDTGDYNKEQGKLEVMLDQKTELKGRRINLLTTIKEHEVVANLLRDGGIKTQIVKQYLPVMNKIIRQYLSDLDLPIHFILDEEFREQIASPLHQDFCYASFSEGQKARIDLSLMFCWREIGKLKNSVSANILFLDEVFSSSLDETGKELLLALIRYKLDDSTRVFVVDHTLSQNFKEKFEKSIEVSRIKGFSQYN